MRNRTINAKYRGLESRKNHIADGLSDDSLPGPGYVFEPLLADVESLLSEIRFDIETLATIAGGDQDFYEEICNDLCDAENKIRKVEKIVAYYELHNAQTKRSQSLFDEIERVVRELSHVFAMNIDIDVIPITWNETALVRIAPESVYGLWIPRNVSVDSFTYFAPLVAHEIGHVTTDYRGVILPDEVNAERKRIAREFGSSRERKVANALSYWYEELYCDSIGALTFGPAYVVTLAQWLFSDNPYELPHQGDVNANHPPDALRYKNAISIIETEFGDDILAETTDKVENFIEHINALSNKQRPSYNDWFDEQYLEAIRNDAKQFLNLDTEQLRAVIENPRLDMPSEVEVRGEVNREIF